MRKIRKRVFAAVLAAALLFTMPGMASYAEAEDAQTKDISESATVLAEYDAGDVDAQKPVEKETVPTPKEDVKECTCGTLCTQDSINGDCPVCGAEDADLSLCKGEKTENRSEENKEDAEQGDTGAQDVGTNLCAHHKEHTQDCGYSPASEDGEGSPCTYECRICPIEDMIAALPGEVTAGNAEKVRVQLDKILALYRELTAEEQEQIDLTRCYDQQAALDEANTPAPIDELTEGAVAQVEIAGSITGCNTIEEAWVAANGKTATITLLADVTAGGTLTVDAGSTITLKGGDYTLTSGEQTAIQVNGTLKLESGTVKSTCSSSQAKGINVSGTLEMTGGTVTTSESIVSGSMAVRADSGGTITVSGGKISGVYGILVNGGTVTIQNGEISGRSTALDINIGAVTIEGGTFTGSMFYGLNVESGSTAVLRGGTFTGGNMGYAIDSKTALSGLLDQTQPSTYYAYFENGKPVALEDGQTSLDGGTFTVGECNHEGGVQDQGNGTHGGNCPYCGTEFAEEPHTLGEGNKCEGCGATLVAQVEIGNDTTYYGDIDAAWEAVENVTSAEITLLDHVTTNYFWGLVSGQNITFNGGNFEYISTQALLSVAGHLTVNSGTFIATGGGQVALNVGLGGTATLNGGTFTGTGGSYWIAIRSQQTPVSEFLAEGCAYYRDGKPIEMTGQTYLEGTVTVRECQHEGVKATPNNDGTHSLKCPYCGYTETPENCDYGTEYQHNDTNHWQTCAVCGYQKTETHTLNLKQGDTVNGVTQNREACDCGFFNAFTVTVTVPSGLTYGNTGGKRVSYTVNPVKSGDAEWELTDMQGKVLKMEDDTLPANLPAGDYRLWIYGSNDSKYVFVGTTIFTVSAAPLTGEMVTLSTESVTYSGAEQKPTITVKQGETTLAPGTDYDVTYSTSDFTNAGTITITITGKGNYTGTVKTTYTIKKAVLKADGTGTANGTYGEKLSDLAVTGLTAVNQGAGKEVPGTWKLTGSTVPAVGDTGTYTATFTPDTGAGNYEPLTAQVKLEIEKAEAPAPPEGTLHVQNNREQSYQYDLTQLLPALDNGKSFGTVNYILGEVNISGDYYMGGAEITGTTLILPIQKVESDKEGNIGEVSITITSGNYKDMSAVINVESVDKIPVTITGVSVAEREYNGKAMERTGTPKAVESNGSTAAISDDDYHYTWQTAEGTVLSGAPKDAGSYQLTVSVDNGTYIGTGTISFVINKAAITITANSMTVNKGSAKPTLTYTISGLAEKEALAVEPTFVCNADMNTAGRYPITVSGAAVPDSNNYHTEITYIPGALTVTASTSGGSSGGGNGGGNTTPGVSAIPAVTDTNTNPGTDTETAKPGTGNTAKPGTGTELESSTAKEERPDTGIPFIKGEDGKIGWNVIRDEEEKAEEGSVINVDMNGTAVVPGDIFDSIKGRDIKITFDMGNGIVWSVDGKSITTDKADDIDFTVRTEGSAVPVEIVNNITGEHYSIRLSLAYDGEFGFIAVLSVGIGEENAGYLASLYYYNEDTGELEFICADEVAQDGTVSFAFTHASDYVVVVDREVEEESGTGETAQTERQDEDGTGSAEESPQAGQPWRPWWPPVIGILVIVIGAGVFFVVKKKEDSE